MSASRRGAVFYALLLGVGRQGSSSVSVHLFADQISLPTGWRTTVVTPIAWTMPFGFIVFLVFLNRFDRTIEEAAAVLGAREDDLPHGDTAGAGAGSARLLLFGFTLSFDEIQRSSLVLGRTRSPSSARQRCITPVLYALGSLIALVSFALVAVYLFFERTSPLLRHACHRGRGGDGHGCGSRSWQRGGELERDLSYLGRH